MPEIRYRLMCDAHGNWSVHWLCGRQWLLVQGPCSETVAREWLDRMLHEIAG